MFDLTTDLIFFSFWAASVLIFFILHKKKIVEFISWKCPLLLFFVSHLIIRDDHAERSYQTILPKQSSRQNYFEPSIRTIIPHTPIRTINPNASRRIVPKWSCGTIIMRKNHPQANHPKNIIPNDHYPERVPPRGAPDLHDSRIHHYEATCSRVLCYKQQAERISTWQAQRRPFRVKSQHEHRAARFPARIAQSSRMLSRRKRISQSPAPTQPIKRSAQPWRYTYDNSSKSPFTAQHNFWGGLKYKDKTAFYNWILKKKAIDHICSHAKKKVKIKTRNIYTVYVSPKLRRNKKSKSKFFF